MMRMKYINKTVLLTICLFVLPVLYTGCGSKRPPPPRITYTKPTRCLPATQRPYKVAGRTYYPLPCAQGFVQVGLASWYGRRFHGRPTANGEPYNMHALTAAHRTLPMNTYVLVKNLENGKKVVVRINDRGPFVKNRIIDLSYKAAKTIGMIGPGTAKVRIVALAEGWASGGMVHYKAHPNPRKGMFYVQVGAFVSPANAFALKKRLSKKYDHVIVTSLTQNGQTYYRVWVYASSDYNQARIFEAKLEKRGFRQAFIIAR